MRLRFGLLALGASCWLAAAPASALTIQLSEMSSEDEEGGTPFSALDAEVTIELSGVDLKITIDNNTSGGFGAGDYDISEIWLNISGETISSVSPAGAGSGATSTGFDLVGPSGVDGFGTFSVGLEVHGDVNQNPDLIVAGEQNVMLILTCLDGDCSGWSLAQTSKGKLVAAKFINGGEVFDEEYEGGNDSAYGASGTGAVVPEPLTAWLLGIGLGALALAERKRAA
jgi:hypothetical protein